MPSTSHIRAFLVVFTILCAGAIVVVLLDALWNHEWANKAVDIGQSASRLFFGAIALTYILVEGGRIVMVLAAWLKESLDNQRKRTEQRVWDRISNEFEEADRQRKGDESVTDAVQRLRREKAGKG